MFLTAWRARGPRPYAACALVSAAAVELAALPLGAPALLALQGPGAGTALLIAVALGGCAVHMAARPALAARSGWLAIVLGLLSCPLANLGGFLVGMLLAITGGAAATAWRAGLETTAAAEAA
ncbi:DUF6114 domain-containing protein [Streptomyces specialis]|uniref:DUF6114 domain-containing protein n=1 Tax=Streptomyces specialis TaxID=498367 RepID=UPI000AAC138B|nr:DUF6114 domain-containing protein [Streptomyces specialis]